MGISSLSSRVFWPSTHASIPAGWTRDTGEDERFLQGDDAGYAEPANGGGDHSHTADAHTHPGGLHTHSFSAFATANPSTVLMKDTGTGPDRVPHDISPAGHTHNIATSNSTAITYQNRVVTISTEDAQPPYMKLIVIKPDSVTEDVPDDAVCFTDETPTGDGLPAGFVKYAGLDDRFVLGADGGSGDGGGTGGALTHLHTSPNHDHQDNPHIHSAKLSGTASPTFQVTAGLPESLGRPIRHHQVSLGSTTTSDVDNTAITVDTASSEPAYVKLLGIQNTSGAATTPVGIIVAFVGNADEIPSNWRLCDGTGDTIDCTNRQVKSTGTDGDVGDTGGSNTHTHTTVGHGHAHAGAHTHSASQTTISTRARQNVSPTKRTITAGSPHTHSWLVGNTKSTMNPTDVTMSTDDGRSDYRTMVWIKKMLERPGARELLMTTF